MKSSSRETSIPRLAPRSSERGFCPAPRDPLSPWAQARKHDDDDQVVALVCLVAMINTSTRLGVIR